MSNNGVEINKPVTERNEQERNEQERNEREQDIQEQMGRAILRYTEELRKELNLRLVTEHEDDAADPWHKYLAPERVLYVDSIMVTDIRYPDK